MSLTDAGELPAPPPSPDAPGEELSLVGLARNSKRYARAWTQLVAGEAALAKVNLVRILVAGLCVPALLIGIVVGLDAVVASLLHRVVADWSIAFAGVVLLNLALLIAVLFVLRGWWRTLSLPRSREALIRLWRNQDDHGSVGKNADTQGIG